MFQIKRRNSFGILNYYHQDDAGKYGKDAFLFSQKEIFFSFPFFVIFSFLPSFFFFF